MSGIENSDSITRILIVDDDLEMLEIVGGHLSNSTSGLYAQTTTDPNQIVPILQKYDDIKLLLCELRMPRTDTIALLENVRERYPNLIFLLMSGIGADNLKKQAIKLDVYKFIEKPFDLPEVEGVIKDALKGQESGFGGLIEAMQLPDIIQMLAVSSRTIALLVSRGTQKATIHFENGEIIHAECGEITGDEVVYDVFGWTGGRFNLENLPIPDVRTVLQSWQALLLEAARRRDEAAENDAEQEEIDSAAQSEELITEDGGELVPSTGSFLGIEDEGMDGLAGVAASETDDNVDPDPGEQSNVIAEEPESAFDTLGADVSQQASMRTVDQQLIRETVENAVESYMKIWSSEKQQIAFKDLKLQLLPVTLRRYLRYSFYHIAMNVMQTEGRLPALTENSEISDEIHQVVDKLYDQWVITSQSLHKMLSDGISFILALAIDPAKAVAGLANPGMGGNPSLVRFLIRALIDHNQLHKQFLPLIDLLDEKDDSKIHHLKVEVLTREILSRMTEDDALTSVKLGMKKIFEFVSAGIGQDIQTLQTSIVSTMLEVKGLSELADLLKLEDQNGISSVSIQDLDKSFSQFSFYRNSFSTV